MNNRERLLMVMDVLRRETDGDHPLTMKQLKLKMKDLTDKKTGDQALF